MCMLNPVTLHVPHSLAESCCASMTTESVNMEGAKKLFANFFFFFNAIS